MSEWTCTYKEVIYDQPILPETKKKASDLNISLDEYMKLFKAADDKEICYVTGHICPGGVANCDAAISLSQIEEEMRVFLSRNFGRQYHVAHFFLMLLAAKVKEIVKDIPEDILLRLIGNGTIQGIAQTLVSELSLKRKEISEWNLVVTRDLAYAIEMSPVNFYRIVALALNPMVIPIMGEKDEDQQH